MYRCKVCSREFTRGDNLKRHILTSHSKSGIEEVDDNICESYMLNNNNNNRVGGGGGDSMTGGGGGGRVFQSHHPFTMTVSGPTS